VNEIATMTEAGQGLEELLRRFELPLIQYTTRITGDSERARDVVQEAFIKLQRNGSVAPEKTPTWLFKVCRNGALNVCRKEKRLMYLDEEIIESHRDEQPLPFEQVERREAGGFLMKILATLPPRQQEVLQLKFQNDLSYQEIAEITKTTANSVGVLIHVALKTLRQRYAASAKDFLPFEPRTT
jgi:RNA polymerase sigma factor (sigma-70 family)